MTLSTIIFSVHAAIGDALLVSNVFGSNMVLQRDRPAPIWGRANRGVEVSVSFDSHTYTSSAGSDGFWKVELPAQPANLVGRDIVISTEGESATLDNVVFGDVIFCSGQSNMEFSVNHVVNKSAEIDAADNYPHIRVFSGPLQVADTLNLPGVFNHTHDMLYYTRLKWSVANRQSIGCVDGSCQGWEYFSAVCWFAIRDLFEMLGGSVPVGGIAQTYGGTSIQYWMSADAIRATNAPEATQCCGQNGGASCLWNTQVHPYTIGPTQLSGVLWYQGEQNADLGQLQDNIYSTMLQNMVEDWRTKLQQPRLAFGSVLLAAWKSDDTTSFPLLRLQQANLTNFLSDTFLISALDGGDPISGAVHSPYKQEVGRRAAKGLGSVAFALPEAAHLGPRYKAAVLEDDSVTVHFEEAGLYGTGVALNASVSCPPHIGTANCESFAVLSAPDCQWHPANAVAVGGAIQLRPDQWQADLRPVATRGYFANWPIVSVTNDKGIPAEPWREYINKADAAVCPLDGTPREPLGKLAEFFMHEGAFAYRRQSSPLSNLVSLIV